MADEVHIGDIGAIFELEIQEDGATIPIDSYTTAKEIIFLKPDGTTKVVNAAVFTTDGTDGKMRYVTTAAGELDQEGNWQMQGRLEKAGENFKTEVVVFPVTANL